MSNTTLVKEKNTEETINSPEKVKKKISLSIDTHGVKCDRVEPGSTAEIQLHFLASLPTVRTRIPRGPGEKPGAFETVIINGLRINILKGESVNLPEEVARIIEDAYYQTEKAVNETKIANPFTGQRKMARVDMQNETDRDILS